MRDPKSHTTRAACILDPGLKIEVSGPREMTNCILEASLTSLGEGGLDWILLVLERVKRAEEGPALETVNKYTVF